MRTSFVLVCLALLAVSVVAVPHHKAHHNQRFATKKAEKASTESLSKWWFFNWFDDDKENEKAGQDIQEEDLVEAQEAPEAVDDVQPVVIDKCAHKKTADGHWIRYEWRELSADDRRDVIEAFNKLKESGNYDRYPLSHKKLDKQIHGTPWFFPWHRWFLQNIENDLRAQGYPCLTLPYWDWTADAADPEDSAVFDSETGFGSLKSGCIDGPFSHWVAANPVGGRDCIHRNPRNSCGGWPGKLLPPAALAAGLYTPKFQEFWRTNEGEAHGGPHCFVGGNMAVMSSPDDPIFFLHHGKVDKNFADWQKCQKLDVSPHGEDWAPSTWQTAFPWEEWRTPRMVMHEELLVGNVESAWSTKDMGYVYASDEFERRSGYFKACEELHTQGQQAPRFKTASRKERQEAVDRAAGSLFKKSATEFGDDDGKLTFAAVAGKVALAWKFTKKLLIASGKAFRETFVDTGDINKAIKAAGTIECEAFGITDQQKQGMPEEWLKMNNLEHVCQNGACTNPCLALEDKAKIPGFAGEGCAEVEDWGKPQEESKEEKKTETKSKSEKKH